MAPRSLAAQSDSTMLPPVTPTEVDVEAAVEVVVEDVVALVTVEAVVVVDVAVDVEVAVVASTTVAVEAVVVEAPTVGALETSRARSRPLLKSAIIGNADEHACRTEGSSSETLRDTVGQWLVG